MSQQFLADWTWMSLFGWVWENNISKNLIETRQIIILMYISFASNLKNTFRAKLCHSHTIWMMIYILSKNPKSSEWCFELLCCMLIAEHPGISHWISTFVRVTDSLFFFVNVDVFTLRTKIVLRQACLKIYWFTIQSKFQLKLLDLKEMNHWKFWIQFKINGFLWGKMKQLSRFDHLFSLSILKRKLLQILLFSIKISRRNRLFTQ